MFVVFLIRADGLNLTEEQLHSEQQVRGKLHSAGQSHCCRRFSLRGFAAFTGTTQETGNNTENSSVFLTGLFPFSAIFFFHCVCLSDNRWRQAVMKAIK